MTSDDANHRVGRICSRYGCGGVSAVDTEMGAMCLGHASPLMFQIQMPYDRNLRSSPDVFLPWEFIRMHDQQAQRNHGGQTLARLSERGGLSAAEALAVLEGRGWSPVDRATALSRIESLLRTWRERAA